MSTDHPPDDVLRDYLNGKVPAPEASPIEAHLGGCEACAARLESLAIGTDSFRERVRDAALTATAEEGGSSIDGFTIGRAWCDAAIGTIVAGRYKLRQVLGEGGMGTVYLAEQIQPIRRQVALKLIRAGMDSRTVLARFDSERQALAIMDHPHIARVLDAGTTDTGHPFFVMELVKGVPLTEFCDQHRLNLPTRLNLFRQICGAVQHAHQKGIIHRDLKPTNILVEDHDGTPVPKVIDFGLAKATSGLQLTEQSLFTAIGTIAGTPLYMAPEQATFNALDVDTRTDIYALGVILYELLTGSTPIRRKSLHMAALDEVLRVIREDEPPIPSHRISSSEALASVAATRQVVPARLRRFVRGDLDWIVMKALAKERSRRYDSAIGLANDVERFLNDEPVTAGPPTTRYRTAKFIRRHRGQVVAAALIVLALVGGVVGTTLGLFKARQQANLANERAEGERTAKETAEAVLGFVEKKIFAAARPQGQDGGLGYDVKLADAIMAALPAIEQGFAPRPLVEARLHATIGQSFEYLGKPNLAAGQFAAARLLTTKHLGPDHLDTLNSMRKLATSYYHAGRHVEALKLREETLALMKARLGPDHPDTLNSMSNLADSYNDAGRHVDAVKLGEETLALMKARLGPDHPDTLNSMRSLADIYSDARRRAEAIKLGEETLALMKAKLSPDHPDTLNSMSNLAGVYSRTGRRPEALKLREETLGLRKAKLGPDHPDTLNSMRSLAFSFCDAGREAEALKLREETLALMKARLGLDHPNTLFSMSNLAGSYNDAGRRAEALKLREETLALRKAKLGPDHLDTLDSMDYLADSYNVTGREAEVLKLREETLALRKTRLGPDHPDTLNSTNNLADALLAAGRTTEAMPLLDMYTTAESQNLIASLKIAALWGWFGQEAKFATTRRRVLAAAQGSDDANVLVRTAKLSSILPSSDGAELAAALALARRAMEPIDETPFRFHRRLALGMAAYRAGDDSACDEALRGAEAAGPATSLVSDTAAFFRAMSLHRRGRVVEARQTATEAAAAMKPLPSDEKNPLTGNNATYEYLIVWLAFKEAKALIGFDAPPVPTASAAK